MTIARSRTSAATAGDVFDAVSVLAPSITERAGEIEAALASHPGVREAVVVDGATLLPAGAELTGVVTSVERSGRIKGRATIAYRFSDDDSRGARFLFRAYAPAQGGWPYEPAGSRPVAVRGR